LIIGEKGLLKTPLRAFYYPSLLQLVLVNIHPFVDGNGRAARPLEKWFLAEKLGAKACQLPTEKYYVGNMQSYFLNLRRLGSSFNTLNDDLCLPFLTMLPKCLFEAESDTI
jgi:hypothetical protein